MSNDPRINTALFNFCLRADDGPREDSAVNAEPIQPRSLEDLRWLREAMSATATPGAPAPLLLAAPPDVVAINRPAAPVAAAAPAPTTTQLQRPIECPEAILGAAEELCELTEDLNFASEFMALRGPALCLEILRAPSLARGAAAVSSADADRFLQLQAVIARTLAGASANYDEFQTHLCQLNWATVVLPLFARAATGQVLPSAASDVTKPTVSRSSASLAASLALCINNIVRQHDAALRVFLEERGLTILAEVVHYQLAAYRENYQVEAGSVQAAVAALEEKKAALLQRRADALSAALAAHEEAPAVITQSKSASPPRVRPTWSTISLGSSGVSEDSNGGVAALGRAVGFAYDPQALRRVLNLLRYIVEEAHIATPASLRAAVDVLADALAADEDARPMLAQAQALRDEVRALHHHQEKGASSSSELQGEEEKDDDEEEDEPQLCVIPQPAVASAVACLHFALHLARKSAAGGLHATAMEGWINHARARLAPKWWPHNVRAVAAAPADPDDEDDVLLHALVKDLRPIMSS
jgi:hypothetical protein